MARGSSGSTRGPRSPLCPAQSSVSRSPKPEYWMAAEKTPMERKNAARSWFFGR